MDRKYSCTLIAVLLVSAGVACAVGVGVGLWSVLGLADAATLLVRGFLALLLILALALIPALVMAHSFARSIREVSDAMQQLRRGNFNCDPRPRGPTELVELANEVRELGFFLQEHDRKIKQTVRANSRIQTQEALRRFGQGVAREVQKSLAGVLGFVEIAQRQPGALGQLKNYLTLIDQEARAGREALDRILRYVRDEEFPTEPLDVNALMMETSQGFLEATEQEKIQIHLNLGRDVPKVMGDAGQIKYVLTSLIDNARESMLPGGGTMELSTNVDQKANVVAMVKDTGRGISDEDQPRIFTPFFTTKGRQKGAGLSLAIAERIIRQHDGRLDFFSEPGKGSVFFIHLTPMKASPTDQSEAS
jgi:signal transduction histidine kinase